MRGPSFRDISIRGKLTALTVLSSAIGLLLAAAALIAFEWFNANAKFVRDLQTITQMLAVNSTAALAFNDAKSATENLVALRAKPEIQLACLYSPDHAGTLASFANDPRLHCPAQPESFGHHDGGSTHTVVSAVELSGERVGTLRLTQSLQPLRDDLLRQIAITVGIMVLSFAVSFGVARRMQGSISGPITALAGTARRVTETRDYDLRAGGMGQDEVGRLVVDFNRMLDELGQARDSLSQEVERRGAANAQLEHTLLQLRNTQEQLVQSEKLASLGALVAGVAHEINTPVGVGVTAASTLAARATQFRERYQADTMTRTDLERFVGVAEESTRILLSNLKRAADLIHSFKQVAVDQSSGERRRFSLAQYIEEIMASLAPQLRRFGHTVNVTCPGNIEVDGYPGALAQIITNFVTNSLVHAYDAGQHGRIEICASERDDMIQLTYRDDGRGMSPEDLARIFDPFFTTKRGSGGSGLGMHIVYNLVTQALRGKIAASSTPGHGLNLCVSFPNGRKERDHERQAAVRA